MSTVKANSHQVGQSGTATNNFTLYQPASPDGTVRLGTGNAGATTLDIATFTSSGKTGLGGVAAPASTLAVGGNPPTPGAIGAVGTSGGVSLALSDNVNNSLYVKHLTGYATIGTDPGGQLALATNGFVDAVRLSSTGVFSMNSGYGSVAPAYGCRAWVNFNQTGTQSIRASGNVSSITDGGVGVTTINFTTAMPDGGYAITMAYSNEVNVQHAVGFITNVTAALTTVSFYNAANSANAADKATVGVSFFR